MGQLLNAEDVAEMLRVTKDWVYAQVRAEKIPHIRLRGRYVRFRQESIEKRLEAKERSKPS
jgi:excisionase family DNA binding protein